MSFKSQSEIKLLGVDTGGTFTDFVFYDRHGMQFHKVLSTPAAPEQAIIQGINEMDLDLEGLKIIHGSTVATNAVLQNKGARTVYITNHGLKDVLTIGRQARRELYNLQPEKTAPPVPQALCLETAGRRDAYGNIIEPLTSGHIEKLVQQVEKLQPEAVAINLLFSFMQGEDELRIATALPDHLFVSCSHQVLPEYREYERGIATWLNAAVGPLVQGYLQRFNVAVQPARVNVMRSTGQTCHTRQAGREAVHLLLSGPAGGLAGARYIGKQTGHRRLLSFDMGGTSTDVAMIDGDIALTSRGKIGHYPVGVPMVDLHSIGAGGGSIARVDAGGSLLVGPESAGSDPGPACYGHGGSAATVTDANLVLGRLPKIARLGGNLTLDMESSRGALATLAQQLDLDSAEAAADGILQVVNENMAQALRVISLQRGIDPREFILTAFGGAGGLHICALAEALEISQAIVPNQAGVLSALGMLVANPGRQLTRTLAGLLKDYTEQDLEQWFTGMITEGIAMLESEGMAPDSIRTGMSLDLCYRGQSSTLNLPRDTIAKLTQQFHTLHKQRFGHALKSDVELVNLRVTVNAPPYDVHMPEHKPTGEYRPVHLEDVYGYAERVSVFRRESIPVAETLHGPAIIIDDNSSTFIENNWTASLDQHANLLLAIRQEPGHP